MSSFTALHLVWYSHRLSFQYDSAVVGCETVSELLRLPTGQVGQTLSLDWLQAFQDKRRNYCYS